MKSNKIDIYSNLLRTLFLGPVGLFYVSKKWGKIVFIIGGPIFVFSPKICECSGLLIYSIILGISLIITYIISVKK